MKRMLHGVTAWLLSTTAFAQEPERSNTSTTTLEIYGIVAIVFVVGFLWVYWKQKKDKERELRRGAPRKS